jgi:6-phosphogluconolactonase
MADIQVKPDLDSIATAGAELTVRVLNHAIANNGQAHWLLAGGTAPLSAYHLLATTYRDQVDWSKVFVAIGDERCVPFDNPNASWPIIDQTLLTPVGLPQDHQLRPRSDQSSEEAAQDYAEMLNSLTVAGDIVPHFDIAWLGMGEDGHTLSLFPGRLIPTQVLVMPVHDSPKPPPDRISLTLGALSSVSNCLIMAAGSGKSDVLARVFGGDESLPINQAIHIIEVASGQVTWLIDEAAASQLKQD